MTNDPVNIDTAPPLVEITILGRVCLARPDMTLVWVLYDEGYIESSNRFCWNGTCLYCTVHLVMPNTRTVVRAKACEVFPSAGLRVVKLGGEFQLAPRLAS
jgi:aerobic-type carbon monoxide dehydrogenase small subunit (CoxS/CutS family)